MGTLRRLALLIALLAVGLAFVIAYGSPQQWLADRVAGEVELTDVPWLSDLQQPAEVTPEELPVYTRTVAGEESFQENFLRLAFSDQEGSSTNSGRVTKWDKRRVRVDILNHADPQMTAYVSHLVRRLNGIQEATTFTLVDAGSAEITIRFVSHERYARTVQGESVGHCESTYYIGESGLISAAITIDAGKLPSTERRRPVVIHELTHALGFRGHLHAPRDRKTSVLFYTPMLNDWTQDDRAAIRIMYSSSIKSGMSERGVRRAMDRIAAAGQR